MFTRIVVPLDGSDRAERALPVAARIARASGAQILLVRAPMVPLTYGVTYEGQSLHWRLVLEEAEEARAYLAKIAQSAHLAGLPVEGVVQVGPPASVILDVVERRGADLVMMTSHGSTALGRWVLGSVAEHVVHHASVPVLLLREHQEGEHRFERAGVDHALRILVPLDGSPLAETVLGPAHALALALTTPGPAYIHLLLVVAPYVTMPESMPDALIMDGAKAYLERTRQHLLARADDGQFTVTWSVVAQGDIAHAIVAAAETGEASVRGGSFQRYDMIAMATHGLGAVARWALGSVTERVLHRTKLPLLVVRPGQVAAHATAEQATAEVTDVAGPA